MSVGIMLGLAWSMMFAPMRRIWRSEVHVVVLRVQIGADRLFPHRARAGIEGGLAERTRENARLEEFKEIRLAALLRHLIERLDGADGSQVTQGS